MVTVTVTKPISTKKTHHGSTGFRNWRLLMDSFTASSCITAFQVEVGWSLVDVDFSIFSLDFQGWDVLRKNIEQGQKLWKWMEWYGDGFGIWVFHEIFVYRFFLFGMHCNPSQQPKIQGDIWWSNLGRLGGGWWYFIDMLRGETEFFRIESLHSLRDNFN